MESDRAYSTSKLSTVTPSKIQSLYISSTLFDTRSRDSWTSEDNYISEEGENLQYFEGSDRYKEEVENEFKRSSATEYAKQPFKSTKSQRLARIKTVARHIISVILPEHENLDNSEINQIVHTEIGRANLNEYELNTLLRVVTEEAIHTSTNMSRNISPFDTAWGNPKIILGNRLARDILDRLRLELIKIYSSEFFDKEIDQEVDDERILYITSLISAKVAEAVQYYGNRKVPFVAKAALLNDIVDDVVTTQLTLNEMTEFLQRLEKSVEQQIASFCRSCSIRTRSPLTSPRSCSSKDEMIISFSRSDDHGLSGSAENSYLPPASDICLCELPSPPVSEHSSRFGEDVEYFSPNGDQHTDATSTSSTLVTSELLSADLNEFGLGLSKETKTDMVSKIKQSIDEYSQIKIMCGMSNDPPPSKASDRKSRRPQFSSVQATESCSRQSRKQPETDVSEPSPELPELESIPEVELDDSVSPLNVLSSYMSSRQNIDSPTGNFADSTLLSSSTDALQNTGNLIYVAELTRADSIVPSVAPTVSSGGPEKIERSEESEKTGSSSSKTSSDTADIQCLKCQRRIRQPLKKISLQSEKTADPDSIKSFDGTKFEASNMTLFDKPIEVVSSANFFPDENVLSVSENKIVSVNQNHSDSLENFRSMSMRPLVIFQRSQSKSLGRRTLPYLSRKPTNEVYQNLLAMIRSSSTEEFTRNHVATKVSFSERIELQRSGLDDPEASMIFIDRNVYDESLDNCSDCVMKRNRTSQSVDSVDSAEMNQDVQRTVSGQTNASTIPLVDDYSLILKLPPSSFSSIQTIRPRNSIQQEALNKNSDEDLNRPIVAMSVGTQTYEGMDKDLQTSES